MLHKTLPHTQVHYQLCTGMRDASNLAERFKWKWSGHVARMANNRWTHKLTMWDPREGRRNVGRLRTRWAGKL